MPSIIAQHHDLRALSHNLAALTPSIDTKIPTIKKQKGFLVRVDAMAGISSDWQCWCCQQSLSAESDLKEDSSLPK